MIPNLKVNEQKGIEFESSVQRLQLSHPEFESLFFNLKTQTFILTLTFICNNLGIEAHVKYLNC